MLFFDLRISLLSSHSFSYLLREYKYFDMSFYEYVVVPSLTFYDSTIGVITMIKIKSTEI